MTTPPPPKFHWIAKIPKWEHVSDHSAQLLFPLPLWREFEIIPDLTWHIGICLNRKIFFHLFISLFISSHYLFISLHWEKISSSHKENLRQHQTWLHIWSDQKKNFHLFIWLFIPSSHSSSLYINSLPHSSSLFSSLHRKTSHLTFHFFISWRELWDNTRFDLTCLDQNFFILFISLFISSR